MTYQNPNQRPYGNTPGQSGGMNPFPTPGQNPGYNSGQNYGQPPAQRPGQKLNRGGSHNYTRSGRIRTGITFAVGYVVVIWAVFIINMVVFGGSLNAYGIRPLDFGGIWGIFFSPFLHANWEHLLSNTVPGAIFCFLIGLSGRLAWWEVTIISLLVGGIGTWLLGGPGTLHIGASGLVYGWLAYLIVRGIFNRSARQFALGVVLGIAYSGLIWGVLPVTPGVSWQGHLFGAIGGIIAGMLITSDDTLAQLQRRQTRR